jgi:hypothetical protein
MVDAKQRDVARVGERLPVAHADEQRTHESGSVRNRDRVDLVECCARFLDRALDHWNDAGEVRARSDLRHHATVNAMHIL